MEKEKTIISYELMQYLPIAILIVLSIFFGLQYKTFFSIANLYNILRQASFLMIISMGMSFVILMGSIDASVGAMVTLTGAISALAVPFMGWAAVFIGILAGALLGFINGLIIVKWKIPSFLETLAMMGALDGIALIVMKSSPINIDCKAYFNITGGSLIGNIPNLSLIPIVVVLICIYIGRRTHFGRSLYVIGANERVSHYSGINVRFTQLMAFMACGLLCGLAGSLEASLFEAACPYMGRDLMMNSIAAVVIGGTQLTGGVGGPIRTIFGVILIAILSSGMNFMGLTTASKEIATGIVMIAAVAANMDRSRMPFVK